MLILDLKGNSLSILVPMKNPIQEHVKSIEFNKGVAIIRLGGDITFETLNAAQDEFAVKTKGKKIKNILFDVKDVSETDTSGIAALIELLKYMKSHQTGDRVGLINVPSKIRNLLTISKTQPLFTEYPSENEAIKALG